MDNRFGDIETFLQVANGGSLASAAKSLAAHAVGRQPQHSTT
jgi:hypothetical protein